MAATEIGLDDRFVAHDFVRLAVSDHMTLIEYQHALGERQDHFHDVLDDDERHSELMDAADQRDRLLQLRRGESRKLFVEQHETRAGREHPGNLEALASGCAQRSGTLRSLRRKTRQLDDVQRMLARIAPMVTAVPSSSTRPVLGVMSPARQLKKVDLPAPFGPIRPMISPSSTARSAPR